MIADLIKLEEKRQEETLSLIPSENYAYSEVRQALGSVLTNKYAEGYPGRRYYQGNEVIDQIERQAIEETLKTFPGLVHANVQAYSGSPANLAVLMALAEIGETILGLKLASGGHLTHGHRVSATGRIFKSVQFGLNSEGKIDYEEVERLISEEKPKEVIVGTTAYPWKIDWERLGEMTKAKGIFLVADISHISGLIAGGVDESMVKDVDVITSTTHKMLRGPRGAIIGVTERGMAKDDELGEKIDKAVFPLLQGGPHMNNIAGIAICMSLARSAEYREYVNQVVKNAKWLADGLSERGLRVTGTENHLMLVEVEVGKGKEIAERLESVGIVVNANTINGDKGSAMKPSGIRIGTPAVTARGMKEREMEIIAEMIVGVIKNEHLKEISNQVKELCRQFPTKN